MSSSIKAASIPSSQSRTGRAPSRLALETNQGSKPAAKQREEDEQIASIAKSLPIVNSKIAESQADLYAKKASSSNSLQDMLASNMQWDMLRKTVDMIGGAIGQLAPTIGKFFTGGDGMQASSNSAWGMAGATGA